MLLFLFGSDGYRMSKESLFERERFFGAGAERNVRKFDGSDRGEFRWSAFAEAVRDTGLFSEKRYVLLENVFSLSEEKKRKLEAWLKSNANPKNNSDVLCVVTDIKPDKRTAIFKTLQKESSKSREFPLLAPAEVSRSAKELAKELFPDVSFERGAMELLVSGCGSDLFRLENELVKVATHAGAEKKVTESNVRALCSARVFEEIFGALEAIGRGDKKNALQLLWRQIKKGEHPIYLLTMCAYQMRTMLLVGECLENGVTVPAEVAREAKIHPFVAQKTIACMRTFGVSRAKKAFGLLGRFDVSVKTGKMDAELALEEFVLRS